MQKSLRFSLLLLFILGTFGTAKVFAQAQSATFSRNLTIGDTGDDVSSLQTFLITDGFLAIPNPTGYFGAMTADAVAKWQASVGLPDTGYFGAMSRSEINNDGTGVSNSSTPNLISTPIPPVTPAAQAQSATFSRNLTIGDTGDDVSSLQTFLITDGFLAIPNPTGYFGAMTADAVAKWQASVGLPDTGYFGAMSRASIALQQTTTNGDIAMAATAPTQPTSQTNQTLPLTAIMNTGGGGGGGGSPTPAPAPISAPTPTPPPTPPPVKPVATSTPTSTVSHPDTTPPSIPTDLKATAISTSEIDLSWTASTDNVGVAGYKIFRGGTQIATTTSATAGTAATTYKNTGLAASTTYSYTISAYDAAGNHSAQSDSVSAKTSAPPVTPPVTTPPPVATSTPPKTTPPPAANNPGFGVAIGESLMGLDSATLNTDLSNLASIGITWISFDMQWDHVQPDNSTTYNWGYIDNFVAAANAHHFKLLPVVDYTPTWAQTSACAASIGTDRCAPADPTQFATFAEAAAKRYTPDGIMDWEIWNEPNFSSDWKPAANANAYAALLKGAYIAIKSVNPSAGVISGGLAPTATGNGDIAPIDFLTQLYAAGAKPYFDAVGFHPYSYPAMPSYYAPWNAWSQMSATSPSLRSVMAANGDSGKRIWMTEFGAPTGGPGVLETSASDTQFKGSPDHVTEAVQAAMLGQAITTVEQWSWAGPLFFYSYQDLGTSESTNENFFGIIRFDDTDKPAYTTIKELLAD